MIPTETATKLAKILPRLGSEHDGEVLNTVRALGRTLVGAGLDWHTLAKVVEEAGAAPEIKLGGFKTRPFDWSGFEDFAAKWKDGEASAQAKPDLDAPEAPSRRWGLPIWGVKKIEPWRVVAGHCLQLDWYVPKAFGGRFLTKDERTRLKAFERLSSTVTNADADWIEGIVARCHAARDAWRTRNQKAAA